MSYCQRCGSPHPNKPCLRQPDYKPGQDIIVTFDGIEHQGHIERIDHGWIHCRIAIQEIADYGSITPRLAPHSTVCVRAAQVRAAP